VWEDIAGEYEDYQDCCEGWAGGARVGLLSGADAAMHFLRG